MSNVNEFKPAAIEFGEEQAMLLDSASNFCREKSSIEKVRLLFESDLGFDNRVWQEMVALGWSGVSIPEAFGGSGLGLAATLPLIECAGRHLLTTPLLSTLMASQAILFGANEDQKARWLPGLCDGTTATLALTELDGSWDLLDIQCRASVSGAGKPGLVLSGYKTFVFDAEISELLVVSVLLEEQPVLLVLEKGQIPKGAIQKEIILDETKRSYRLRLDDIHISADSVFPGEASKATFNHINLMANLLISAELSGSTAATVNTIVAYLNERKQFDRLIGSYQALKHPTVDALMGLEASRSLLYHAASIWDTDQKALEIAVRMAKAQACDAAIYAGDRAVQFHGGFGFTYECDAQLYLRRALCSQFQFGDSAHHRKHLAPLLLN